MDDQEYRQGRTARAEARRQALELRIQDRWGKASANLAENHPTDRLAALHEHHKALCFNDVHDSLTETCIEYAAKYWMLREQYDRDADIHDAIQARHLFIFPDALYHVRAVEAEKGRRNILQPQSYFGVTKLEELGTQDFAINARQFLEKRYITREQIQSYLGGYKAVDIRSSKESAEEWVSNSTRPVLSVFHHDLGNTANKSGIFHAIKNYAMFAIAHPQKTLDLENNMRVTTQKFLDRIPHIQSIQSFIQRINAYSGDSVTEQAKPFAPNVHSLFGKNRITPEIKEP